MLFYLRSSGVKPIKRLLNVMDAGFTLIELIIVITILGTISAVVIPLFSGLSDEALDAAKKEVSATARSGHAVTVATLGSEVTVSQVSAQLNGSNAIASGIQVSIDGANYVIPTYTDADCTTPTTAAGDLVMCVGSIP